MSCSIWIVHCCQVTSTHGTFRAVVIGCIVHLYCYDWCRDPLNFSQKLIRQVIWPVLSDRLNRIEVPNIREESSKNLYAIEEIVIHVTSFPKVRVSCRHAWFLRRPKIVNFGLLYHLG